jgi:ornithine--oxo-acid transaminase
MLSEFRKGSAGYISQQTGRFAAHNYDPYPVVLAKGEGAWVWDVNSKKYLDMLSSYSATNFGYGHPRLVATLKYQLDSGLAVMSRTYMTDVFGEFCEKLVNFCGGTNGHLNKVIPMNTGAEAVETAIKLVRKYGYSRFGKQIPRHQANIIVCDNNFHGRTSTIVGFSSVSQYRDDFGPYDGGFKHVPFGDVNALVGAIDHNTVAFLVEPIQGEGGINVPPAGYFKKVKKLCEERNIFLIFDEVQTGFGRTGSNFAYQYEDVMPNILILGKALGGGLLPISAVVADDFIASVFEPGDHGSTFGGNPLACVVAIEAMGVLQDEKLSLRAYALGEYFTSRLNSISSPHIKDVRGRGLMIGLELDIDGRKFCERMIEYGVLCQYTRKNVIRLSPPLIITREEIDWTLDKIESVLYQYK